MSSINEIEYINSNTRKCIVKQSYKFIFISICKVTIYFKHFRERLEYLLHVPSSASPHLCKPVGQVLKKPSFVNHFQCTVTILLGPQAKLFRSIFHALCHKPSIQK